MVLLPIDFETVVGRMRPSRQFADAQLKKSLAAGAPDGDGVYLDLEARCGQLGYLDQG